jgi:hypothetical protein
MSHLTPHVVKRKKCDHENLQHFKDKWLSINPYIKFDDLVLMD